MSIIQNHLYNIVFEKNQMINILRKIDEYKDHIYPQTSKKLKEVIDGIQQYEGQNPYQNILDDMINVMNLLDIQERKDFQTDEKVDLQYVKEFIKDIDQRIFEIQETIKSIEIEKEENEQAIQLLNHLNKENYSLDDIQNLKYMTLRFGKLSLQQENKLKYYQKEHFVYKELSRDLQYIWIVYGSDNDEISAIDNIFSSMNFEFVQLPQFAHGKIKVAIEELNNEAITMEKYIETLKDRIKKIKEEHKDIILLYYHKISYLKMLCDHCHYVFDLENKGLIYAYSPFGRNEMKQIFNMEDVSIIELPADIYCQFGMISPVIVKNNPFVRPFETLIHFKKGDVFDPTSLLMIVMMISALLLGDLGIGVIMILISVIFKGKMMPLLQRMAIPVTIGGIVTGSFFYRMTLYHPLFIIFNSVLTRMSLFVLINVFAYAMLMIWKDIQRKRHLTKEGYNGDFKAKFSEY